MDDGVRSSTQPGMRKAASSMSDVFSRQEIIQLLGSLITKLEWRLDGMRFASADQRMDIMQVVKAEVLPLFGLPVSAKGNVVFMLHLAPHMDDPSVASLVKTLNSRSGMDEGTCRDFEDAMSDLSVEHSRRSSSMSSFNAASPKVAHSRKSSSMSFFTAASPTACEETSVKVSPKACEETPVKDEKSKNARSSATRRGSRMSSSASAFTPASVKACEEVPVTEILKLLRSLMTELEWRLNGMRYASAEQRMDIMQAVKAEVLPLFGLPGSAEGNMVLMHQLAAHMDDPSVAYLVKTLNSRSGMDEGTCRDFEDTMSDLSVAHSRRSSSMSSFTAASPEVAPSRRSSIMSSFTADSPTASVAHSRRFSSMSSFTDASPKAGEGTPVKEETSKRAQEASSKHESLVHEDMARLTGA